MSPEAAFSAQVRKLIDFGNAAEGAFSPLHASFRLESSHIFPGLPDWVILRNVTGRRGRILTKVVFLELKVERETFTPAQKVVFKALRAAGFPVRVLTKVEDGVKLDGVHYPQLHLALAEIFS